MDPRTLVSTITPSPTDGSGPAAVRSALRGAAGHLIRPTTLGTVAACALMLLACNVNERVGHRFVTFRHFYVHAFLLCALLVVARRSAAVPRAGWSRIAARAGFGLCWFLPFCLLIGAGAPVSNGTTYQAMATNFWGTDPFASTSRRIALPALANVLGFESHGYVYFWYAVVFAAFVGAVRYLERSGLKRIETFSLLTSSIFAYALIGPGYSEIFVFLLGLLAIQVRLGASAKVLVATLMIATHETTAPFVAAAVILSAEDDDRAEWITTFLVLYAIYAASYLLTWRADALAALTRAGRPTADAADSSVSLALHHPFGALFGIFIGYKLYWSAVAIGSARRGSRAMALAAAGPIVLVLFGTDTSRLVQFGSLALFAVAGAVLPTLPDRTRLRLALANLVIPSLYVATNVLVQARVVPRGGRGLSSLYFRATQAVGLEWGALFLP